MWLVVWSVSRGKFVKFRSLRVNWLVYPKVTFKWKFVIGGLTFEMVLSNRKLASIFYFYLIGINGYLWVVSGSCREL